ncbi:MAG: amidohydrolase [Clostridiales Family XIII bacterium]|jgi:aminobenzoyl-glutamate utilization protein B|nr:amidohydrolase [Clostridiales Family XIII bacterium]
MREKKTLFDWIDENRSDFLAVSKAIWENPELSVQEYFAAGQLTALLEKNGFSVERGLAGFPTSFIGTYGSGSPVIGFSSEYDALPGLSQRRGSAGHEPLVPGGPGHGCTHNLIAVGGILAACALKDWLQAEGLDATVKVFGTPAEELCMGKPFMARAGCFDGVDVFLDFHPFHRNLGGACTTNAYFNVKYHFDGVTAHGNAPWHGRSAQDAGVLMGIALEFLREHLPPGTEDMPTTFNYAFPDEGKSFPNVVPDKHTLWCVGRMANAEMAAEALKRVEDCAKGSAIATGTHVTAEIISATHELLPNLKMSEVLDKNLREAGLPQFSAAEEALAKALQRTLGVPETGYGGEILPVGISGQPVTDSSEYSWFAPIGFLNIQIAPSEAFGWHNWAVTSLGGSSAGEKVVTVAGKTLAGAAFDLIRAPEILADAQREWKDRLNGRTYKTLLPEGLEPDLGINKA